MSDGQESSADAVGGPQVVRKSAPGRLVDALGPGGVDALIAALDQAKAERVAAVLSGIE